MILQDVKPGSYVVSITTATMPKLLKKHRQTGENPYPNGVVRIARRRAIIGCTYQGAVNRQRERENLEQDFIPETTWYSRFNAFLVKHNDKEQYYLAYRPHTGGNDEPQVDEDEYRDAKTGKVLNDLEVLDLKRNLMPAPSKSSRQGTEKQTPWRVVMVENVVSLKCGDVINYHNETLAQELAG